VPADIQRRLPTGYYGHLHNFYVQYAAESGIASLLLVSWFLSLAGWDGVQAIRSAGKGKSDQVFVLHGSVAVLIGILVGGLFEHNLGDSEVLMMFVCVVGLEYAAIGNLKPRERS
jgi:O-antigen ligase